MCGMNGIVTFFKGSPNTYKSSRIDQRRNGGSTASVRGPGGYLFFYIMYLSSKILSVLVFLCNHNYYKNLLSSYTIR